MWAAHLKRDAANSGWIKLHNQPRRYCMKAIRVLKYWLAPIARSRVGLPLKRRSALTFWRREIQVYTKWYQGKIAHHYGVAAPTDEMKVTGYNLKENAIRTWANADIDKYPYHLLIPEDYFHGKRILDVGCGPIPYALAFTDCEICGLDPLIDKYRELGFPLDKYSDRLTYVRTGAENMPFEDNFFDAVISVNAIDHVDDSPAAAKEVSRVLRPEGVLRIEVHYHQPEITEPWSLSDDIVTKHFDHLGIRKIHERLFTELYPESPERGEKVAIWANRDCVISNISTIH